MNGEKSHLVAVAGDAILLVNVAGAAGLTTGADLSMLKFHVAVAIGLVAMIVVNVAGVGT